MKKAPAFARALTSLSMRAVLTKTRTTLSGNSV
jgi:hypothetical protein